MPNLKTITQNLAVEDVRSIIDSIGQENPENLIDAPEFLLCLCSSLLRKPDVKAKDFALVFRVMDLYEDFDEFLKNEEFLWEMNRRGKEKFLRGLEIWFKEVEGKRYTFCHSTDLPKILAGEDDLLLQSLPIFAGSWDNEDALEKSIDLLLRNIGRREENKNLDLYSKILDIIDTDPRFQEEFDLVSEIAWYFVRSFFFDYCPYDYSPSFGYDFSPCVQKIERRICNLLKRDSLEEFFSQVSRKIFGGTRKREARKPELVQLR